MIIFFIQVNNSGDNSSPDPGFSALIPAGDVEYALREAGKNYNII